MFLPLLERSGAFVVEDARFFPPLLIHVSSSQASLQQSRTLPFLHKMSRHPTVKWAQRSDKVYLTIELPDAKDVKLELELEGRFVFNATRDGVPYEIDIELFDKINVCKESKSDIGARNIVCAVKKAEKKWWSRLLKQEGKPPAFLKVDWDKWIDEDDENGVAEN